MLSLCQTRQDNPFLWHNWQLWLPISPSLSFSIQAYYLVVRWMRVSRMLFKAKASFSLSLSLSWARYLNMEGAIKGMILMGRLVHSSYKKKKNKSVREACSSFWFQVDFRFPLPFPTPIPKWVHTHWPSHSLIHAHSNAYNWDPWANLKKGKKSKKKRHLQSLISSWWMTRKLNLIHLNANWIFYIYIYMQKALHSAERCFFFLKFSQ